MQREIGITVKEALCLEPICRARVVGGKEGLHRVIKSINVMEVPDIIQWVKEGEFLLTTVFAIRDDTEAQRQLIPNLSKKGLAGIAIKPGRYIEKIPEIMIAQANEFNFPLIELPFEISFSDLMNPILKEIFNIQGLFVQKSLETHEILMNVVLQGGGLQDIVTNLANLVQNPVVLLGNNLELLGSDLFDQFTKEEIFKYDVSTKTWFLNTNLLEEEQHQMGLFTESLIKVKGKTIRQLSIPISVGQQNYGFIYVWETTGKLKSIDLVSIERAIPVAAMDILNQQSIFEVEWRYHNDFLYDLLNGRYETEDVIISRAKHFGWDLKESFAVVIFDFLDEENEEGKIRQKHSTWMHILRGINHLLGSQKEKVILGNWSSKLVLLQTTSGKLEVKGNLDENIRKILMLIKHYHRKCYIGVGSFVGGIAILKKSYAEAREAVKIAKMTGKEGVPIFYEDLGIYRLLSGIKKEVLRDFVEDILGRLIQYDKDHNTELLKTLDLYFHHNGNLSNLSRSLFVHYNTVVYRLERIQNILGLNLNDRGKSLDLEMAIKIIPILTGDK